MWARSPSTVNSTINGLVTLIKGWKEVGISPDFPELGPWSLSDKVGFRLAIGQLSFLRNYKNVTLFLSHIILQST